MPVPPAETVQGSVLDMGGPNGWGPLPTLPETHLTLQMVFVPTQTCVFSDNIIDNIIDS